MSEPEEIGTFVLLYEDDGGVTSISRGDESSIDAAVDRWIREGNDTLLDLTTASGDNYRLRASCVRGWLVSTPEGRRRNLELLKLQKDEDTHHRSALGLPWEDAE